MFSWFSSLLFFLPKNGYIINRLISFFDPSQGDKFQSSCFGRNKIRWINRSGEGILKERVPEAHTDYVIANLWFIIGINFNTNYFFIYFTRN